MRADRMPLLHDISHRVFITFIAQVVQGIAIIYERRFSSYHLRLRNFARLCRVSLVAQIVKLGKAVSRVRLRCLCHVRVEARAERAVADAK